MPPPLPKIWDKSKWPFIFMASNEKRALLSHALKGYTNFDQSPEKSGIDGLNHIIGFQLLSGRIPFFDGWILVFDY